MIDDISPLAKKLTSFMNKKLGFKTPPRLFLKDDLKNSKDVFGKTAFYDPGKSSVTVFISGRHPKDVLRSLAHELVHHHQNERGDFSEDKCGDVSDTYAQDNKHLRNMEKEAYLVGNMCFRDWEDSCKFNISEKRFLKENKKMSAKLNKTVLKEMITNLLIREQDAFGEKISSGESVSVTMSGELWKKAANTVYEWDLAKRKTMADEVASAVRERVRKLKGQGQHEKAKLLMNQKMRGITMSHSAMMLRDAEKLLASRPGRLVMGFNPSEDSPEHSRSLAAPDIVEKLLKKGKISMQDLQGQGKFPDMPQHWWVGDQRVVSHYGANVHTQVAQILQKKIPGSAPETQVAPDKAPKKKVQPPPLEEGEGGTGDCGCTDLDGTPEREENLYTERFEQRDTAIFNRLLKEWIR